MLTEGALRAYKKHGPRKEGRAGGVRIPSALELGRRDGTLAPGVSILPPQPSSQARPSLEKSVPRHGRKYLAAMGRCNSASYSGIAYQGRMGRSGSTRAVTKSSAQSPSMGDRGDFAHHRAVTKKNRYL